MSPTRNILWWIEKSNASISLWLLRVAGYGIAKVQRKEMGSVAKNDKRGDKLPLICHHKSRQHKRRRRDLENNKRLGRAGSWSLSLECNRRMLQGDEPPQPPLTHACESDRTYFYVPAYELCAQERLMRTEEGINAQLLNWLENLLINGPNACSQVTETVRGSIISGMKYCSSCQAALYSNWTFAYLHLRLCPSQPSK